MVLSKSVLISVNLHLNGDVAEAWQTENFLGFCRLGQVIRKRGRFVILGSSGDDGRVVII
jgi:hypothetical protein